MDKRIIAAIIVIVVAIFGGLSFFLKNQKTSSVVTPVLETTLSQTATPVPNIIYKDDSGFSFRYPGNLTVVKQDIKDNITYSDLKLSSSGLQETINVKVTDTKLTTPNQWVTQNKSTLVSPVITDITLGGIPAKEIRTSDKIIAIFIDQSILFKIEAEKEAESVYAAIVSSFAFSTDESSQSSNSQASVSDPSDFEDDSVVEEEIVE